MTDRTDTPPAATGGDGDESPASPVERDKPRSLWRELPVLVIIAVGLALLIKTFFLQAFFIPSGSMEKTLHGCPGCHGDRVLVNKLVYDFRDPHRGEIVVFNGDFTDPTTQSRFPDESVDTEPANKVAAGVRKVTGFLGLGSGGDSDFIKRVIAVGGDTVSCPPSAADPNICTRVLVNGTALDESAYLYESNGTYTAPMQQMPFAEVKVPQGRLFVMGDHRDDSADSRPGLSNATVPVDKVVGRAFVVVWPVSRFGRLPVPDTFDKPLSAASAALNRGAAPPAAAAALALPLVGLRLRSRRRSQRPRGSRRP